MLLTFRIVKKFCESSFAIIKVLEELLKGKAKKDDNIINKDEFMKKTMFRICFEYFKTHTEISGRDTVRFEVEEMTRTTDISNVEINIDYSSYGEEPKYYRVRLFREQLQDPDIISWWREPSYFSNPDIKRYLKSLPLDSNIQRIFKTYNIDIELLFQKIQE